MRLEYIIQVLHTKPYLSSHLTGNSCPDNMIGKRDTVYALARSGGKRSNAAREATVRRQSEAIRTNPFRLCPHLVIFPRDDGWPGFCKTQFPRDWKRQRVDEGCLPGDARDNRGSVSVPLPRQLPTGGRCSIDTLSGEETATSRPHLRNSSKILFPQ